MKFLGKLILWLLVALLLVIIGAWFLLQTHWGARQASAWLSNGTGWQVSFDEMEHDFSSPLHVQLRNVTFGREGKPATLVAKTVDIGFSTRRRQPMDAGGGQCAGENGADPDERGLDDAQWRRSQQRSDSG